MEIIAKTTDGVMLNVSHEEIQAILSSVHGEDKVKADIGVKIPGLDYSKTIQKVRSLASSYQVRQLKDQIESFNVEVEKLYLALNDAKEV